MKKYHYYSIIGLRATGESFMKIVCIETEYHFTKNSNNYISAAVEYVVNKYNICVSSVNVLYSSDNKLNNMPNVDEIEVK